MKKVNILKNYESFKDRQNWLPKDAGLALFDLDGTLRKTKSGETFINEPKDQILFDGVLDKLKALKALNYSIYGVSNQGGISAGHKTLESTIKEMRYTLKLCPYLDKIYFAEQDDICWCITRFSLFDFLQPAVPGQLSELILPYVE